MIKITITNAGQYTKAGKLKKRGVAEYRTNILDGENVDERMQQIAEQIIGFGYKEFESPYIFTSITCRDGKGERCYIQQDFVFDNGQELLTSPVKLREKLLALTK
jgi:hypothetical protein